MAGPNLLRGCARTCCVVESLNHSHHEAKENSFMNTYLYHPLPHVLHVWYIYLQNWVILFGQMWVNIPAPWSIWVLVDVTYHHRSCCLIYEYITIVTYMSHNIVVWGDIKYSYAHSGASIECRANGPM